MWHQTTNFSTGVNPAPGLSLGDAYKLWDYRSHQRSPAFMTGTSAVFALAQVWQTRMALDGIRTHTIDCAMRFNTYAIADECLRLQRSPESIHDQITITRAFTPYQILDAVRELKKNEVVFVLAPAKQFFDGDVAFDEGLFLIQKLVRYFADAHERGVALFVVERPSYAAPAFSTFLSDMRALTHRSRWELFRLANENAFRLKLTSNGVLTRDILSVPENKPREIAKSNYLPVQSSQMQLAF